MKIFTLTYHRSCSHGALLQCYAFIRFLRNAGHDAQVLDYHCKAIEEEYSLFNFYKGTSVSLFGRLKRLIANLLSLPYNLKRKYAFRRFRMKNLQISCKAYCNIDSLLNDPPLADLFFSGSDQVWNPDITSGLDPVYFLQFKNTNAKTASVAACIGKEDLTELDKKNIINYIKKIDNITVREIATQQFLLESGCKNIECICDPVFLLNKIEWEWIINKQSLVDEPYLLVYSLAHDPYLYNCAREYAANFNLKLLDIGMDIFRKETTEKTFYAIGPDELASLIYHASCVFTNSFHGAAMSIVFEKQFACFIPLLRKERLKNLMRMFDLEAWTVGENFDLQRIATPICYDAKRNLIAEYREQSKDILFSIIKLATPKKTTHLDVGDNYDDFKFRK